MTEEVQDQSTPEVNPIEVAARQHGWRPKEEFEGPEERWVDAEEFVKRQPLFEKIESLKSELWRTNQEHKKEIGVIKEHFTKVQENAYKQALKDLKAQRVEALADRDVETAVKIEEQIDELQDEMAQKKAQAAPTHQQAAPNPAFVSWVEKNSWYAQDAELRADADGFGVAYLSTHPQADISEVLRHVDGKMKKLYPDRFGGESETKRSEAPTVEGSTHSAPRGKGKFTVKDLSPDEREVMNTLVHKHKLYKSEEEYLKAYQDSN